MIFGDVYCESLVTRMVHYIRPRTSLTDVNIKFEYGHKRVSGSVAVGVYPGGFGIIPAWNTDLSYPYALTIHY